MELHIIPLDENGQRDKFIIYRPLAGIAFVGNQATVKVVQEIAGGEQPTAGNSQANEALSAFLQDTGFLERDPPPPQQSNGPLTPTTAVLLMTNACQLRCTYCYAAAGEFPAEYLTFEQGKAAIDHVCQSAQQQGHNAFALSFHGGGEPTLAWKVLKACAAYAREKPLPARISLTSNGVWSQQQRDWILENIDELTLSLDGRPQTQDRQRPFLSGLGSAEPVFATLAELDRAKFRYGIRMTATAPWERLPEDVLYLCTETNCRTFQVEPAYNEVRGEHASGRETETRAFASAFVEAAEIAKERGRTLHYSGARFGTTSAVFCRAPYEALIISPNGRLVCCYEVTGDHHPLSDISTIGQFDGRTVNVDEAARARLHMLIAERQTGCENCFCFRSCAGDCYTRAFDHGPAGHLVHGSRCSINRQIFKHQLLQAIAQGEGVLRPSRNGHQRLPQRAPEKLSGQAAVERKSSIPERSG